MIRKPSLDEQIAELRATGEAIATARDLVLGLGAAVLLLAVALPFLFI